jgi:hypothetical protein
MLWIKSAWRSSVIALVVLSATTGCSSVSGPSSTDRVDARARNGQIEVLNNSDQPAFIYLIGRDAAAYTDWIACADASACTPIPAGGRRTLLYPSSQVGVGEREAIVYWWHAVKGADARFRPDSIRSLIVPL